MSGYENLDAPNGRFAAVADKAVKFFEAVADAVTPAEEAPAKQKNTDLALAFFACGSNSSLRPAIQSTRNYGTCPQA